MDQKFLKEKIQEGLKDSESRVGRFRAFGAIRPAMLAMTARYPNLREHLSKVKERSIDNIDNLTKEAIQSLEQKGCKVFVANNGHEAAQYIGKIVENKLVVKSKSNAGKEINIAKHLESQGAQVIETDLGDYINQLAKSEPSHTLAPAVHIPMERVAELFSEKTGQEVEANLDALIKCAREELRNYLENAAIGISGANAIVANTGAIFVTENEGNIRAVTSMPKIHIAIAGIEKIVPTLKDALTVVKAAATFGVGQDIGTYVSVIAGPGRYTDDSLDFLGNGQGPEELHVVLLTQGRREAINEGYSQTLHCINCGSCLNFCPIYSEIGSKYGYKYLGGRGTVFSNFHADLDKAVQAGLSYCINCLKCVDSCAAMINAPEMITRMRAKQVEKEGLGWTKKQVFKTLANNNLGKYLKIARNFQGLGLKRQGDCKATLRVNLFSSLGAPSNRLVPALATKNFAEQVEERTKIKKTKQRVAFFAGCMVNYVHPEIGLDLLDVLEAHGIEVLTFKDEACCGLPALMSGAQEEGTALARQNTELFSQEKFDYLLFVCPSCATTVTKEWSSLLKDESQGVALKYQELAKKVMDINIFLLEVLKLKDCFTKLENKVTYHDPCHLARGQGVKEAPRTLLKGVCDFVEMNEADTCCGFGGSFSLFYYDLAKRINASKAENIKATGAEYVATSCPGCMAHIADGLYQENSNIKVVHNIQLLAQAMKGGKSNGAANKNS